jgi:predicted nucleic acid-binding protein
MIVFDSSTLILLAKAELLEKFIEAAGVEALIPPEVARESCEMKQAFDALVIARLIGEKKIRVHPLKDRTAFDRLRRDMSLGAGEAEAVALAMRMRADLVATDDRHGINACRLVKVPFTSALAILVRMFQNGVLSREEAVEKLAILEREGRYKRALISAARAHLEAK